MNSTGSTNQTFGDAAGGDEYLGDESIARLVQLLQSADPAVRSAAAEQLKALGARRQADLEPSAAVRTLKGGAMFTLGTIQFLIGLAMLALLLIRLLLQFAR
jgi:hypothetical protein